jgi:hypothetical protein
VNDNSDTEIGVGRRASSCLRFILFGVAVAFALG